MSVGYGASARKVLEDEHTVIYEYSEYNPDYPRRHGEEPVYDGMIAIQKGCFVEPEIHEKLRRMPSGRKQLVTKRIPVSVEYSKLILEGQITFENSSRCWRMMDGDLREMHMDAMIYRLLDKIFLGYQEDGEIPDKVGLDV